MILFNVMNFSRKDHWDHVYEMNKTEEVSWAQEIPETSLELIRQLDISKTASIIDIGGGDSRLVDHLLTDGYCNITVLDISRIAIARAKERIGRNACRVRWLIRDVLDFSPDQKYDLWHDRATFHFLTEDYEIRHYIKIARKATIKFLTMATFSDRGPEKCSGLEVRRYSEDTLQLELANGFHKIRCITEDHITPFNTRQNFLFCSFRRTP